MSDESIKNIKVIDPYCVSELPCDGPINVHFIGDRAVLTFTHPRAESQNAFTDNRLEISFLVKSRILLTKDSLINLRDLLTTICSEEANRGPSRTASGVVH